MFNILVVEDDANARKLMCAVLYQYGYNPIPVEDGVQGLDMLDQKHIDLIILDIMMPRMDGYEFTSTLRQTDCNIPILMVTAKESPADKRKGFLMGTDDYMTKPVDEEEMILRVGALLRRSRIASERRLSVGNTTLMYDSFSITCGDEPVELPQKEFLVLFKLLSYPNKIFTRRPWACRPTAITSAICGFSCADAVRIIPALVFSSASMNLITTRFDKGLRVISIPPYETIMISFFIFMV